MYEFVDFLVAKFIDKSNYEIVMTEDNENVDIRVIVDKDYIGCIIGKNGKIAKAIRTLLKSFGRKFDKNYSLFIEER